MQLDEGWLRLRRRWPHVGRLALVDPECGTRIDTANVGWRDDGHVPCDKPSVIDGAVHGVPEDWPMAGETEGSEAFFLRIRNLLHVDDP
jgi:hypothetical protein